MSSIPPPPPPLPPNQQSATNTIPPLPPQFNHGVAPPPPPPGFNIGTLPPPLPKDWSEHIGPTGQPYFYHQPSGQSSWIRPLPGFGPPGPHFAQHSQPNEGASKKKKKEKPKTKVPIPGTDWIKVTTSEGNVFYNNKQTKESKWEIPVDIFDKVKELEEEEKRIESEKLEKQRQEEEHEKQRKEAEEAHQQQSIKKKLDNKVQPEDVKKPAADNDNDNDEMVEDESLEFGEETEEVKRIREEMDKERGVKRPPPQDSSKEGKSRSKKKKVVTDIEELDADEDWQRSVAEQIVNEQEDGEGGIKPGQEEKKKKETSPPPTFPNLSTDERRVLFKTMLTEKDIDPMAPWDDELPKFINDPRYLAVKGLHDRRNLFNEVCREVIRERRQKKYAGAQIDEKNPSDAFNDLLEAKVTSTRTLFSDFKSQNQRDSRFIAFGRNDQEREKMFKKYLRELGERKRKIAEKSEAEFMEMLKESSSTIADGVDWVLIKKDFSKDSRYKAIVSSSQKEELFKKFLSRRSTDGKDREDSSQRSKSREYSPSQNEDKDGEKARRDAEKAERREAALRERGEQARRERERVDRQTQKSRSAAERDEGEREFQNLLTDAVRSHETKWNDVEHKLSRDRRWNHISLTASIRKDLFDSHIDRIYKKRWSAVEDLFEEHAPRLDTSFKRVYDKIAGSTALSALNINDEEKLEKHYNEWQERRKDRAKVEFEQLMKESEFIEFWGRMKKQALESANEKDESHVLENSSGDEEDEEHTSRLDLKQMAKSVDLKEMHAVLKRDKRYRILDSEPEMREKWMRDHLEKLSKPKTTVYQKD